MNDECKNCGFSMPRSMRRCKYCGTENPNTTAEPEKENRQSFSNRANVTSSTVSKSSQKEPFNVGLFIVLLICCWPAAIVYLIAGLIDASSNKKR